MVRRRLRPSGVGCGVRGSSLEFICAGHEAYGTTANTDEPPRTGLNGGQNGGQKSPSRPAGMPALPCRNAAAERDDVSEGHAAPRRQLDPFPQRVGVDAQLLTNARARPDEGGRTGQSGVSCRPRPAKAAKDRSTRSAGTGSMGTGRATRHVRRAGRASLRPRSFDGRSRFRRQRRLVRHLPVHKVQVRTRGAVHEAPAAVSGMRQR